MQETERRTFALSDIEVRDGEDGEPAKIVGMAAVYNSLSLDLGGFQEVVAPGAARRSLKERGKVVSSYFNHNPDHVLGRTDNKTLTVRDTEEGLYYEVVPPDTTWARDLITSMKRGDIKDASFSFRVLKDRWESQDGVEVRTLLEISLEELGPVARGAYPAASSQVRSLLAARGITLDLDHHAPAARLADLLEGWPDMEPDEIRTAIAILTGRLPPLEEPPVAEAPPEAAPSHRLALMRRRLELVMAR